MNNYYIVKIVKHTTFYNEWYIKRVIDYKRKKIVLYPWENYAHKYVKEKSAQKAADAFNGKVEIR